MKKVLILAALVIMAILNVSGANAMNLVSNGDFETGDFSSWTTSDINMIVDNSWAYSGNYAAHLATKGKLGELTQSQIPTTPGFSYELSYYLINSGGLNEFQTLINGVQYFSELNDGSSPYSRYSFIFTAGDLPTEITFLERQEYGGFHLDDISVAPVPEPATLLLLGSGLFGVGFLRRKIQS